MRVSTARASLALALLSASCQTSAPAPDPEPGDARGPGQASSLEEERAKAQADQKFALKLLAGGRALFAQGDHADALASFTETLRLYPDSGLAHLEWAIAAQYVGEDPALIEPHLLRALALMPKNPRARYQHALFQEAYGDPAAAQASYREVLRMRAEHDDARVRLAGLLLAHDDEASAKEAMALYQAATQRDPARVDAQLGLARAAERVGALDVAERAMRQIISANPEVSAHRRRLISFYKRTDQKRKARRAKKELDRVDPEKKRKLRRLKKRRRR